MVRVRAGGARGTCVQSCERVRAVRAVRAYSRASVCARCARYVRTVVRACACGARGISVQCMWLVYAMMRGPRMQPSYMQCVPRSPDPCSVTFCTLPTAVLTYSKCRRRCLMPMYIVPPAGNQDPLFRERRVKELGC